MIRTRRLRLIVAISVVGIILLGTSIYSQPVGAANEKFAAFSSPAAAQNYQLYGEIGKTVAANQYAAAITSKDPKVEATTYRSTGCSDGCSTGCSTGCSMGCSSGCSSGCSMGCSSGCRY